MMDGIGDSIGEARAIDMQLEPASLREGRKRRQLGRRVGSAQLGRLGDRDDLRLRFMHDAEADAIERLGETTAEVTIILAPHINWEAVETRLDVLDRDAVARYGVTVGDLNRVIEAAIGGSRIDEHQASPADHADLSTMYGRMLWRVQQARLTHGIRGILWHQGENDQGADGPMGGFGWETYQRLFVEMAGGWKRDFPNVQHYYVFQIWPNSCAMGGRDGAGDDDSGGGRGARDPPVRHAAAAHHHWEETAPRIVRPHPLHLRRYARHHGGSQSGLIRPQRHRAARAG